MKNKSSNIKTFPGKPCANLNKFLIISIHKPIKSRILDTEYWIQNTDANLNKFLVISIHKPIKSSHIKAFSGKPCINLNKILIKSWHFFLASSILSSCKCIGFSILNFYMYWLHEWMHKWFHMALWPIQNYNLRYRSFLI